MKTSAVNKLDLTWKQSFLIYAICHCPAFHYAAFKHAECHYAERH
jgi:hypothetical protein